MLPQPLIISKVRLSLHCCAGDGVLSFLRHHDWEIRAMDAQLEVVSDGDDELRKVTVNLVSSQAQSTGG